MLKCKIGEIDKRVQYTIEQLFAIRKANFNEHPALKPELDLVDLEDQITHEDLSIEDTYDPEDRYNFFQFDEKYTVIPQIIHCDSNINSRKMKKSMTCFAAIC